MTRWLLVGLIILFNACADLLDTAGMRRQGELEDLDARGFARFIRAIFHNSYVIGGILANAASFFALMSLLSIASISFAVPATAGSFVLETLLAKIVLREDVHWQRWLGVAVVSVGVALLALP